ncbi:MAG: YlbE-like family protein [Bacilli bacterium]|nr:YlbE-like family protein [Bacilli bacterium]MDD4282483.1 YlbE-like family protein [Bacilli bacterium]MDD4718849.1 YlbE-like family protein [Bacilli bacterium]
MTLEIQFRIKNDSNFQKYIREHSYWYKILNRNPEFFKRFEEEVKEKYQLRPIDRFNKAIESIELLSSVFSALK